MARNSQSIFQKLDYAVPSHANTLLYMFGGISATAFLILIATGVFLTQVYNPTPTGAHASIVNAVVNIPFADFVRSVHFWAANLVVVLLLLHIIRVFITGSYKKPRRLTWLTGVALLAVTITYIFVGTVLKWDQEGVEAYGHLEESFELFGIGIGLTNAGVPVITQLYSWHTTILLLALLGLLAVHMVLIKLRGISPKPGKNAVAAVTAGQGSSSFLLHLRKLCGFGLIFLSVASLLAVAFPAPLGYPGILEQEVTRPLWMFWPFFGLEDIFELKGLIFGMLGFFAFLAAVPFIDRSPSLYWKKRKLILSLGFILLVSLIGLAVFSRLYEAEAHLEAEDNKAAVATADNLELSHQRLRSEALYLVPAAIAIGAFGVRLALRPERRRGTKTARKETRLPKRAASGARHQG